MLTQAGLYRLYQKYVEEQQDKIDSGDLPEDTEIESWEDYQNGYEDYCYEGRDHY